eukprot:CAMPEP_0117066026 /NCGR_PEP_ID=MMETSP0472-20121206/46190_1 /TAXON_ID=693140 ORGANISM="Tiarina fusus, Strain LIS" /NCGR_SAMPLE_ID=MMETSP0472 /ASSEMBLY_ACC=CAM_ASM_000603 /LENGTH=95 /DNA_ID=CAMNT_0004786951 /DNA_START=1517 /DNA_END=1801 /DNA_ORIENTATION=-
MGDKFQSPDFSHALATVALLLRGSSGLEEDEEEEEEEEEDYEFCAGDNPFALPGERVDIPYDALRRFLEDNFLKKIVEDKRNAEPLCSIICYLSW